MQPSSKWQGLDAWYLVLVWKGTFYMKFVSHRALSVVGRIVVC